MMVMQLEHWDYVDVCFVFLCFYFFFPTWPRCCLPSVCVNSCHKKKSHINCKRHNKLIFVKLLDFLFNFSSPSKIVFHDQTFSLMQMKYNNAVPWCVSRGSSWPMAAGCTARSRVHPAWTISEGGSFRSWRAVGAEANKSQPSAEQGHQIEVCC